MNDTKAPINEQVTINTQPQPRAQPAYMKYKEQTGTEQWNNDIWDCFKGADNLCLKATFCSCFVYGRTQARLRDPTLAGYERINNDCLMFAGLNCCGLGFVLEFLKRTEIRAKYALRGDAVTDGLLSFCCGCCSMIQGEKEVIGRQQMEGVNMGMGKGDGYMRAEGMQVHPPTQ
ncbi:hypothetical protein VTL71DRAFT_9194 [Oculimacula yallundae]|uniref:Uncharacterized protein n=1 Tax=Oculimacula yallundae TaxID=86028 RepID=A0ABR4BSC4_9HELO